MQWASPSATKRLDGTVARIERILRHANLRDCVFESFKQMSSESAATSAEPYIPVDDHERRRIRECPESICESRHAIMGEF